MDTDNLAAGISKHKNKDVIFIDTMGRNPLDSSYAKELRLVYSLGAPIETHLLMSTGLDDLYMTDSYKHYSKFPIDCIGVTKMDEASRYGNIFNLSALYKKPIAYVTTGQSVPEDIAFPSRESLTDLILGRPELAAGMSSQSGTGVV
jgi:flagellar biosynthesis protein FlhF